ncbi:MAG: Endonuclease/Exonuclease/phosphatase family protein [Lentisphaerae bacterium ADurb.Bin082]|nr:MAG: Endonuclease/Exonuclease/phosphatase family protein [Lentisphaerae bacterium ADurb.Bin082]
MRLLACHIIIMLALAQLPVIAGEVTPSDDDRVIRVATFNIRRPGDTPPNNWRNRTPRIRALLKRHRVDLVGLQEASYRQIEAIVHYTGLAYIGNGRDDGDKQGEHCCILYRKERFECLESHTFWLSETPEIPGSHSWKALYPRICTWGRFRDRRSGITFVHINTHFDHSSQSAREHAAKLIINKLPDIRRGHPAILTGDFNAGPDYPSVKMLKSIFKNSYRYSLTSPTGPTGTFHGFKPTPEKLARLPIDFVFISQRFEVLEHHTLTDSLNGLYPSDHFPVLAVLRLPKPSKPPAPAPEPLVIAPVMPAAAP